MPRPKPTPERKSRSGSYVHEEQRRGLKIQFRLPESEAAELAALARRRGTTPNALAAEWVRSRLGTGRGVAARAAHDSDQPRGPEAMNCENCGETVSDDETVDNRCSYCAQVVMNGLRARVRELEALVSEESAEAVRVIAQAACERLRTDAVGGDRCASDCIDDAIRRRHDDL